jgi:hypothetical protein
MIRLTSPAAFSVNVMAMLHSLPSELSYLDSLNLPILPASDAATKRH